ncbi:MAG: OmpP1/FadL family transporter [Myxococcota bacterium]
MPGRLVRTVVVSTLVLGLGVAESHAAGMELPGHGTRALSRGGAFAVLADNPTAIALNPGALTRLSGNHVYVNNTFFHSSTTFRRVESSIPRTDELAFSPTETVRNEKPLFPLGPFGVAVSDFGLEDFTFGFGVWGPNAIGNKEFPVDGGQRYMLTRMEAKLFFVGGAVAWGKPDEFGLGLTLMYANAQEVKMKLVADGSLGGALNPYYSSTDVEADVSMSDATSFSAVLGGWWRPIDEIELGVSSRFVPVYLDLQGDWTLHNIPGQTQFAEDRLVVSDSSATMDFVLPPKVRAGVRYRHLDGVREVFDVELNVVYEAWSMIEEYEVDLEGEINLFAPHPAPDVVVDKKWRDTLSVRLGSTWNVLEAVSLSAGGFWEQGATPNGYEHLDFPSYDRFGFGLGIQGQAGPVTLGMSYGHIFEEDRRVSEIEGKVYQVRPLAECPGEGCEYDGVPANAGIHQGSYDLFSASLQCSF